MPKPGKAPLKRLYREKMPWYLHASLRRDQHFHGREAAGDTHARSHGSYLGCPAACLYFLTSKPVMFGFSACCARSSLWGETIVRAIIYKQARQIDMTDLVGCILRAVGASIANVDNGRTTKLMAERAVPHEARHWVYVVVDWFNRLGRSNDSAPGCHWTC